MVMAQFDCATLLHPLDPLEFGVYTFPVGRLQELMPFLDPLEGTEINKREVRAFFFAHESEQDACPSCPLFSLSLY